jgi:hypothetical protein
VVLTFNGLRGIISQTTELFIATAVRTSKPTYRRALYDILLESAQKLYVNELEGYHMDCSDRSWIPTTQPASCQAEMNYYEIGLW